ncbi:nucleolar complex protein 4 homolog isoform X2 [Octopus bimaculoides]|uniref:nucleolar complex protein 4 homolog isoform X2 n=1 Tax=Octopus bimaculoides TaxID=37653 RepID=UPI00071E2223|nr:nucleolar complex protein 4 homolog isoform X2 [Octopus bimaculoides]|eukprot:XP_014777488.1 PREDICTED: nucleolar complex protein 4 homolog isoform X2 [Octopus bimaculoides]
MTPYFFPFDFLCHFIFCKITPIILNTDENIQELLKSESSSFENENVRLNFLRHIANILTSKNQEKCSSDSNIFCCLELIMTEFLKASKSENSNENKAEKKLLNKCLLTFLQQKLAFGLYKRVLASVTDVISCLERPLQLSDFLFNSFKMGGSVSLLSLNGIFILMDKHNLNYPDFYKKLYSLLDPAIFHFKYRAKFFSNLNLFLSSKYLPAYMLAAFIKRLARISLYAPTHALVPTIPTIYNLINRQNACKVLINRTEGQTEYSSDPYLPDEVDPVKCCALESSLWELRALQSHYCPKVAVDSRKVNQLKKSQKDLSDILETTTDDLFANEIERGEKLKEVPVNQSCPSGILTKQDMKYSFWRVE